MRAIIPDSHLSADVLLKSSDDTKNAEIEKNQCANVEIRIIETVKMEFTIDANGSDKSRNIFTPPDEGGSPTQPYDIIKKGNSNKDAEFQSNLEAIQSEMNAFARKQDKKQKDRPIAKIVF